MQIIKDETEELKDMKQDIIHKLSMSNINGFETFEAFVKRSFDRNEFDLEDTATRVEVSNEYKERQLWVLDKLLKLNYFQKGGHDRNLQNRENERYTGRNHYYENPVFQSPLKDNLTLNHVESTHTNFNDEVSYQGREKKLSSIKLSKSIHNYDDILENERKNEKGLEKIVEENLFFLNPIEVQKVINSKNHKTYYIESEIKEQYKTLREGLLNLLKKIENSPGYGCKDLSEDELKLIINASSFSLNSIHFKVKFNKSDYILVPEDIVYLINKLDLNEPTDIKNDTHWTN